MPVWKPTDLGLTYEEAAHGLQTAIAYKLEQGGELARDMEPKHMRTGIDMQKADMGGLLLLLISKGVFTEKEIADAMRLAMNTELAMHETEYAPPGVHFR